MLIEYFLLVAWLRRRTSRLRLAVVIGLAICIAVPLLQQFVTTDRERIVTACEAMVQAVDVGDLPTIDAHLSAKFSTEEHDKESFMAFVGRRLERHEIEDAKLTIRSIEINGLNAVVVIRVDCTVDSNSYQGPLPSSWELTFEQEGDEWRMISVKPIQIGPQKFTRLSDLPG